MRFIIYVITYPFLWCVSMLPFPILYLLSDFIYLIVYHGIGYRKKIVRENIALALPNLSEQERLTIEKKFFRHLCDIFLEMIKTLSISKKEMSHRFVFTNLEVYKNLEKKQKSIAIMMATKDHAAITIMCSLWFIYLQPCISSALLFLTSVIQSTPRTQAYPSYLRALHTPRLPRSQRLTSWQTRSSP